MGWDSGFQEGNAVLLATASRRGEPNANIVLSLGFVDGQLLIADAHMDTTIRNLRENDRASVVGGYFRIKGKAKLSASGEDFDICVKRLANNKVKTAILVSIEEVFDLEQCKKIR